jgi:hypothetical protein
MRLARLALVFTFAAGPAAAGRDGMSFTTNIDDDQPIVTCADIDMKFWKDRKGDLVNARRDQSVPVSLGSTPLRVVASHNGGVRVQRASGSSATAVVCMGAGATSQSAADAILDKVAIVNRNGQLTVDGPDGGNWAAYIILSVPNDVALDLEAENGSLALHGVSGSFTLRTTNGPIHIAEVSGKVDGEAVNGPIHYTGHSGDVRLEAQNGPIGVKLDAATWTGKGLSASTQNGPVDFAAPANLRTGVEVEASEHSPFHWHSFGDKSDARWDGDRTVRLGSGPVLVRLSTVNGPVNIQGPEKSRPNSRGSKSVRI